jgi:tetratricopeptide (TPR) repeat protein
MCPTLKRLSKKFQPLDNVVQLILEILFQKEVKDIRILEHLFLYAEYQFYRGMNESQRVSIWETDFLFLYKITNAIINVFRNDSQLSNIIRHDKMLPYYAKQLRLLNPWLVRLDSNRQTDNLSDKQTESLLGELYGIECGMAVLTYQSNQFDASEKHCQKCLSHSRRLSVEGGKRTTAVLAALHHYVNLRQYQSDYLGAVTYAEEAYNLVVEAYDPAHPEVQGAANTLIYALSLQGDLENAQRFSEQTYLNLRDHKNGINQESDEVAVGAYNLSSIIFQQQDGDLMFAENKARESLRIICQLHDADDAKVGRHCLLLARILQKQEKFSNETKELFERALAIFTRHEGRDGTNSAVGNIAIGQFHYNWSVRHIGSAKRIHLLRAKAYSEEGLRIAMILHAPTHGHYIGATEILTLVSEALSNL